MPDIYISTGSVLFKKKLLSLRILNSAFRPDWLAPDEAVPVFFPEVYDSKIDGEVVAIFEDGRKTFPAIIKKGDVFIFSFDPQRSIDFLVTEEYFVKKSAHNLLGLSRFGYLIPPPARRYFKRASYLLCKGSGSLFPAWPIEKSVELIRYVVNRVRGERRVPVWPAGKSCAVALSHDIDSMRGFDNIGKMLEIEDRYRVKSTWFAAGSDMRKSPASLDSLIEDGHEVGLHGAKHDHLYSSLDSARIRDELSGYKDTVSRFRVKGFRSPYLGRSRALFNALEGMFEYDSSVPDTALLSPHPFVTGACTIRPYRIGGLIEVPITVPLDSSLLFLGYKEDDIFNTWRTKTEWIQKTGGAAVVVTHTEPHFVLAKGMLGAYSKFVEWISGRSDVWVTTISEIARVAGRTPVERITMKEYAHE